MSVCFCKGAAKDAGADYNCLGYEPMSLEWFLLDGVTFSSEGAQLPYTAASWGEGCSWLDETGDCGWSVSDCRRR